MYKHSNVCQCGQCMTYLTYLTTSQHLCVNACSYSYACSSTKHVKLLTLGLKHMKNRPNRGEICERKQIKIKESKI